MYVSKKPRKSASYGSRRGHKKEGIEQAGREEGRCKDKEGEGLIIGGKSRCRSNCGSEKHAGATSGEMQDLTKLLTPYLFSPMPSIGPQRWVLGQSPQLISYIALPDNMPLKEALFHMWWGSQRWSSWHCRNAGDHQGHRTITKQNQIFKCGRR